MRDLRKFLILISVLFALSLPLRAEEINLGSDFVSSYIWRGQRVGGISIQPYMEYSYKGFTLGSWASIDVEDRYNTELDFYLAYSFRGFTMTYTDYFFNWENKPFFNNWKNNHTGDISIEYDFQEKKPFIVKWSIFVLNDDHFSGYGEFIWLFKSGDIDCELFAGMTPWSGIYNDKFSIVNLGFKAIKNLKFGDFDLPVSGSLIFNPVKADIPKLFNQDGAYFVLGVSL